MRDTLEDIYNDQIVREGEFGGDQIVVHDYSRG